MAFITTNTDNQIIIDAVLTKRGRELLASGVSQFNISKFAVADDQIDYGIPGLEHIINNEPDELPILQPIINGSLMMKSFLFTDPNAGNGRYILPLISISGLLTGVSNIINGGISVTYTPSTINTSERYQIKINGGKYALKQLFEQVGDTRHMSYAASGTTDPYNADTIGVVHNPITTGNSSIDSLDTSISLANQSSITLKTLKVSTIKTFSMTIIGSQTGASITYSFTISPSNVGFDSGTGAIPAK